MPVTGVHHVTAVTAEIVPNLDFYTGTLGMRLVKKSVNQDDVRAYHLFYGDAFGSPGTGLTFFDWPNMGAAKAGPGTVALTSLRVPAGSLDAWEVRLGEAQVPVDRDEDPRGRPRLLLADPEGQRLALVEDAGLPVIATGWDRVVPAEQSTRGFLGVDLESARPDATHRVLTEVLGFQSAKGGDAPVYEVRGEDTFGEVRLVPPTANRLGSVGAGGVHHVAFRVPNDESLLEMLEKIDSAGFRTSGYVDRFWFHSIYFREPGGILFELATDGPGFDVDESRETLGEKIVLPRFLEDRRNAIEADLKPLPAPVYLR